MMGWHASAKSSVATTIYIIGAFFVRDIFSPTVNNAM